MKFWQALCRILKIEGLLSTPFHPQTDGQTERSDAILEQYLRPYVNYLQDDWAAWLHLAEFAGSNHASESTGMSPFFANYGQDLLWQFDLMKTRNQPEEQTANQLAERFKEITEHLQAELVRVQMMYQEQADKKRKPAPVLKVGDQVWFNPKNLSTQRPSKKLDHRRLGSYKITRIIRPYAYDIDLPPTL